MIIKTLLIGSIGGVIFNVLLLPLPWVLGPAFIIAIAALFKIEVKIPSDFRNPFIGIIGVWLGTSFNQSLLENLDIWILSLTLLIVYVPFAYLITFFFLVKFRKMNVRDQKQIALFFAPSIY